MLQVPQGPVNLKSWSPGWHYWEVVEHLRGRTLLKVLGHGGVPSAGIVGLRSHSLSAS